MAVLAKFKGRMMPEKELAKQGSYEHAFRSGAFQAFKGQRAPPLIPDEFARRVAHKTLTNGKDKKVLIELQSKVATTVLGNAKELVFMELGWGAEEVILLSAALRMCPQLQSLSLNNNPEALRDNASAPQPRGADGYEALVSALAHTPELATLDLGDCGVGPAGAQIIGTALREGMATLKSIDLRSNDLGTEGWCAIFNALRDNKENKIESWDLSGQGINPEIVKALAEYISVSSAMKKINLSGNDIKDAGAIAIGESLKNNKMLEVLELRSNEIGASGAKAIGEALQLGISALTSLDLKFNHLGVEGAVQTRVCGFRDPLQQVSTCD